MEIPEVTESKPLYHWLVSGVGRSGTTAIYEILQSISRGGPNEFQYFYEPYLWSEAAWNSDWDAVSTKFSTTDSVSPVGLATHLTTPLFLHDETPGHHDLHDHFVDGLFGSKTNALAKIIRGSGRLHTYCRRCASVKIIHITRNPLDTINSVLGQFSFFGDEFHPSDRLRFFREIDDPEDLGADSASEAELAVRWWEAMNNAAYRTAALFPDRILVLPYEAFTNEPAATLHQVVSFLGGDTKTIPALDFSRPRGPVTKKINLKLADVKLLEGFSERYFEDMEQRSSLPLEFDPGEKFKLVVDKYSSVPDGSYAPRIDRSASPLSVRSVLEEEMLNRKREQKRHLDVQRYLGRLLAEARWALRRSKLETMQDQADVADKFSALKDNRQLGRAMMFSKHLRNRIDKVDRTIQVLRAEPSITCIVTSYNNGVALRNAVNSVLSQNLLPKEIIIADDGSTGGSYDLAKTIASEHNFIRLISQERNVGPGANRHSAILEAQSSFITTLDGDDEFGPRKMAAEWNAVGGKLNRIVYSDYFQIMEGRGISIRDLRGFQQLDKEERVAAIFSRSVHIPRDMLFSKDTYVQSGGYETTAEIYEDWSLKMRLAKFTDEWRYVKTAGTLYYKSTTGLSAVSGEKHVFWKLYALSKNANWAVDYLTVEQLGLAIDRAIDHHGSVEFKERFRAALVLLKSRKSFELFFGEFDRLLGDSEWRGADEELLGDLLKDLLMMFEEQMSAGAT